MKNFYLLCLTSLMFTTLSVTSCSDPDELENGQLSSSATITNQFPHADRVIAPVSTTHKLILQNNSDTSIVIWDILADGGRHGGSESFLVHFKGTGLENFTIAPFQTIAFENFITTSPSNFAIEKWRAENATTHPATDYIDIAPKIFDEFAKQYPNLAPHNKYSDWIGIHLMAMSNEQSAFPYAMGDATGLDAAFLGNMTYPGNNSQITFGYNANTPTVKAHWSPQANGNIIVTITNN